MEENNVNNKKRFPLFLILTIVFALLSVYLFVQLNKVQNNLVTEITTKDTLLAEKQKMMIQLENLQIEYSQLKLEYEGLGDLFEKEQKKIESLLKQLKSEKGSTAAFKKQVDLLKMQLRDYLSQIETLQARNQELNEENIKVKSALDSTIYEKNALESENVSLNEKVEMGSMLQIYEVLSDGIRLKSNGDEIPTKKAKRVKRIRTCFILSENSIAERGLKTIYLRIAAPNGNILVKGTSDANMFMYKGEKIAWSVKGQINYENKAMDLCYYWEQGSGSLEPGIYSVDIFIGDYLLGTSRIVLE